MGIVACGASGRNGFISINGLKKFLFSGSDNASLEEVIYEGFGPGGEAFYIKGITDNKNRTVAEIRGILN